MEFTQKVNGLKGMRTDEKKGKERALISQKFVSWRSPACELSGFEVRPKSN
jgi:hypothetical protein